MIQFEADAPVLTAALKSILTFLKTVPGANPSLYVSVVDADSEEEHSESFAGTIGAGRVIIGAASYGRDSRFVDIPATAISGTGRYLLSRPERIAAWASKLGTGLARVAYVQGDEGGQYVLSHARGEKVLPAFSSLTEDEVLGRFPAASDRVGRALPQVWGGDDLIEGLKAAVNVSSGGDAGARAGDLVAGVEEGFTFKGSLSAIDYLLGSSVHLQDMSVLDFEWEVTSGQLEALLAAARSDGARLGYSGGESPVVQLRYSSRVGRSGDTYFYVEDQMSAPNQHEPVQVGDFEEDASPVWADISASELFTTFEILSTLSDRYDAKVQRVPGSNLVSVSTSDDDGDEVAANAGPATTESYVVSQAIVPLLQALSGSAERVRIRAFEIDGEEAELAFVFEPTTAEGNSVGRHGIVTWR